MVGNLLVIAATLMTGWGEQITSENAWREYPRPQMVRDNWTCLNGEWDYAVTSISNTPARPTKWTGKIRVPFCAESRLSGVGRLIEPTELLWYTRPIECRKRSGERILLHFDAVDYMALVFIGHREVTAVPHEGGFEPFTLDITDFVRNGTNQLTVCVWDPTGNHLTGRNPRGKQALNPRGCYYTRVTGIWQSVWMESVPKTYIAGYRVYPDIDKGEVEFEFDVAGGAANRVEVEIAGAKKVGKNRYRFEGEYKLWSPEEPNLIDFTASAGKDRIKGYFAMRKLSKAEDAKGRLRFFLNNKPYYVIGTLDQGWWPDGLLTPPSDEAMAYDITTLKNCGFNTMRKHIKVEPRRYYHLCDKLGILVIQDMPSATWGWTLMSPEQLANSIELYGNFRREMKAMIDELQAVPSIVMWCPYNEGWSQPGEFLTHATLDFVRYYDRTRLVNGPSGCWDWEGGHLLPNGWGNNTLEVRAETEHKPKGRCEAADTVDMHLYRGPAMFKTNDRRISFLGEFGGLGQPTPGHMWKEGEGNWGYGGMEDTATSEGLEKTYLGLMAKLENLAAEGLGGSIYTQTTDVEGELNGLMTYDRKVLKFNPEVLKAAHEKIKAKIYE